MDVILDTNVYYALVNSQGGQFTSGNIFTELVTYLRRTKSNLVIPRLVYEEFSQRYLDLITESSRAACEAWATLRKRLISEVHEMSPCDALQELKGLQEWLRSPAQGFYSLLQEDYAGVSVDEVVRRGIHRMPPANQEGEELRDVVLWLSVLEHAKNHGVAFISADKAFKIQEELRPELIKEIQTLGVSLLYYPSISKFIAANSLTSEAATEDEIAKLVTQKELSDLVAAFLPGKTIPEGTIRIAKLSQIQFQAATKYKVTQDSYYIEAAYTVEARLTVEYFSFNNFYKPSNPAQTPAQNAFLDGKISSLSELLNPSLEDFALVSGRYNFATTPFPKEFLYTPASTLAAAIFDSTFELDYSFRLTSGKPESLELNQVRVATTVPVPSKTPETKK